jgi:hypothetical protein
MENEMGNKRARVTRGGRNPKHGKRKALHCAQTYSILIEAIITSKTSKAIGYIILYENHHHDTYTDVWNNKSWLQEEQDEHGHGK